MDKKDYGFYGKGLDGYVHYKQSFDRIGKKSADPLTASGKNLPMLLLAGTGNPPAV